MSERWLEKAVSDGQVIKFEYEKFTKGLKIGDGGFGTVYKYEWKDKNITVALKCLKVDINLNREVTKEFIRELKVLHKVCNHPNIIEFYGITKDNQGYYNMVLQLANDGNLRQYLRKNFKKLQWKDKLHIAIEILGGLIFLHDKNIVHRDLHSKNILIHQGQIKIADFGLAKEMNEASKSTTSAVQGMTAFIDPQCLIIPKYKRNKKSDVYSFGVILWEISSGRPPFESYDLGVMLEFNF
ncbi:kinase-like protein [Gigaspora margarita]|uniref:Kinase-like protein n=1 Tax=Gigaspora margarita TaxID=4874 RepID=A0A8H3XM67_GIGMA|nr:kinase-like protein [Gigaspora margarita]